MSRGRYDDALQCAPLRNVSRMAVRLVGSLMNESVGEQLAGFAMVFLLVCKRFGTEPRVALQAAERMLREAERQNFADVRALYRTMREELVQ